LINENQVVNEKLRVSSGELGKLRNENRSLKEEIENIRRQLQEKGIEIQNVVTSQRGSFEQEKSRLTS
jgi:butyrate kinase